MADQLTSELPNRRLTGLPIQRWQICLEKPEIAQQLAELTNISPIISQLLINRGMETKEQVQAFLDPESLNLPSPLSEFPDLAISLELLESAIASKEKIAICGDYDADGMTSTALLLRSLRTLGADVDYAIPSRMHEGYGINKRIVEEFEQEGVKLILTVDNGISAYDAIAFARELNLKVIITDHHDIPQQLPPANAILNPKLIAESSPYRSVAGVGVAYILAVSLAQKLGQAKGLIQPMLALFTLGTIADLAPLVGVNRRWVKRGLQQLPKSKLAGVQALIQVAGVGAGDKETRGVGDEGIHNSSFLNPNSRRDVPAEGLYPNTDVPAEGLYPNTDVPAEGLYPNTDVPAEGLYPNTDVPAERLYPNTEVPPEGLYPNTEVPPEGLYPNTEVPAERLYPTRNSSNPKSLKPEDIGFRLGPRINAIGRIGDPQIVIDLLTTDDMGIALARAMQCEAINKQRQQMCSEIELEAIAIVEAEFISSLQQNRVLVVVKSNWHHGVIGIVASRLVERYGVPVFIATYEDETHIRGSARGIPEFNVFAALEYCHDLLGKYGGHKAAGGFSFPAENLPALRSLLCEFANKSLALEHIKPLIKIDAKANLNEIKSQLYQQLNVLHPCGIDNPDPVFWTPDVQVIEQKIVGKGHIKLTVAQIIDNRQFKIKAIAWRWGDYFPLPSKVDIAYKLRENNFNGSTTIELELTGVRLAKQSHLSFTSTSTPSKSTFEYNQRHYSCGIYQNGELPELRIKNSEGKVLAVQPGQSNALLGTNRQDAKIVDISQPQYDGIIQAALKALKSVKS